MFGHSWVAAKLAASQERLSFMQRVIYIIYVSANSGMIITA
jgi:hypothetical protein